MDIPDDSDDSVKILGYARFRRFRLDRVDCSCIYQK